MTPQEKRKKTIYLKVVNDLLLKIIEDNKSKDEILLPKAIAECITDVENDIFAKIFLKKTIDGTHTLFIHNKKIKII